MADNAANHSGLEEFRANSGEPIEGNSKKASGLNSAGIKSPAILDSLPNYPGRAQTIPISVNKRAADIPRERTPDRTGMRRSLPKPSATPEKTPSRSDALNTVHPISTGERPLIDHPNRNSAIILEPISSGRQQTEPTIPKTTFSRSPSQQAAPPAVHVTIGRIEVRATSPPQAPPDGDRPQISGPLLSLNDYLNRRSGKNQ
jgi:hypothetical protein